MPKKILTKAELSSWLKIKPYFINTIFLFQTRNKKPFRFWKGFLYLILKLPKSFQRFINSLTCPIF